MNKDIAIDLGTSNIRIFSQSKKILINEPAVVTVNNSNGEIIAIGNKAYEMLGRTSDRISVIYPINAGVVSDFDLAEQLIASLLKQVYSNAIFMPRVVVNIPGEMTEVEKRAVVNSITSVGIKKVFLIENPLSSAIGAGVDIFSPSGSIVMDIGGGTTDIAVISLSGISVLKSLKLAGQNIDRQIIKYIRKKYSLLIGIPTAENIKTTIGNTYPLDETVYCTVKGKDMVSGVPTSVQISSEEIHDVCLPVVNEITKAVCEVLEETPPELISDIYSKGLILTGGLAKLSGIDKTLSLATNIEVKIADEPELCSIKGIGESLKFINSFDKKNSSTLTPLMAGF